MASLGLLEQFTGRFKDRSRGHAVGSAAKVWGAGRGTCALCRHIPLNAKAPQQIRGLPPAAAWEEAAAALFYRSSGASRFAPRVTCGPRLLPWLMTRTMSDISPAAANGLRSEENTPELQSLMRSSY